MSRPLRIECQAVRATLWRWKHAIAWKWPGPSERRAGSGSAVITAPGRLADHGVRWVVHAVGPIWRGGHDGEEQLLRSAYETSFRLAEEAGARSVAFPAISAGVYGYPLAGAAAVALRTVRDCLARAQSIERGVFVLFGSDTFDAFGRALRELAARS